MEGNKGGVSPRIEPTRAAGASNYHHTRAVPYETMMCDSSSLPALQDHTHFQLHGRGRTGCENTCHRTRGNETRCFGKHRPQTFVFFEGMHSKGTYDQDRKCARPVSAYAILVQAAVLLLLLLLLLLHVACKFQR